MLRRRVGREKIRSFCSRPPEVRCGIGWDWDLVYPLLCCTYPPAYVTVLGACFLYLFPSLMDLSVRTRVVGACAKWPRCTTSRAVWHEGAQGKVRADLPKVYPWTSVPERNDGAFVFSSVCDMFNGVLAFVSKRDPRSAKPEAAYVMS